MHKAPSSSRNDVVVHDEELEADNEDQVNDPMEVYDNNNIVQDDGTNQMIQDLFGHPDEDHGDNSDGIYDEPLIENANRRLYKGSRENFLSTNFLSVKLKVMNHLSNTCMTQILRYGEIESYESFVEHLYDTDPKVCNMFLHIYIRVDFSPFF
jgi:hypothetical protein